MTKPNLAIIIPTCNRPRSLGQLVDELLPNMIPTDMVFVVNDGDSETFDKSQNPVVDTMVENQQVDIINHCKDYYALASGRNKGIERAMDMGFRYGLCLDDDIELESNIIEQHKIAAEKVDDKTLLAGKIVTHDSKPEDARRKWIRKSEEDIDLERDGIVKWGGSNLSFNMAKVMEHGGFNTSFDGHWGYEDNEFYWRMRGKNGFDIQYLSEAIVLNKQLPRAGDHYKRYDTTNREKLPREAFYKEPEG